MDADTTDVVRLIGQHLVSLGFSRSADSLFEESKIGHLDHPIAAKFRQQILDGEWSNADMTLDELSSFLYENSQETLDEMRCLIAEQNFLELIEEGNHLKALKCLRKDLSPKQKDIIKIKRLSTMLMCKSNEAIKARVNWLGKGAKSRQLLMEKFHRYIPPSILLPPKRLSKLLEQAVQLQREQCLLHNSSYEPIDLKTNHLCSTSNIQFPVETIFSCNREDEIWFCKFSNDGLRLATSGRRGKITIWGLNSKRTSLIEQSVLKCEGAFAIANLSWSPNDQHILACGSEEQPDCWLFNVNTNETKEIIKHSSEKSMTTCSWHSTGQLFALGSTKGNFIIYDIDAKEKFNREGVRVICLSFLNHDSKYILAADALNRIKRYDIDKLPPACLDQQSNPPIDPKSEEEVIEEEHPIICFTIDKDDHYIAINLARQGIRLWDYKTRTLLQVFNGICERNYNIYSSFSPFSEKFLATGSEDQKVYIYRPGRTDPVIELCGHTKPVNCVSWNPKFPQLLASGSDDRTLRLWGPSLNEIN